MTTFKKRPERLLSRREVLDRVGVSYPTLWHWMRTGKFPRSRQIGGKIAFLESEVDRWMAALPTVKLKGDAGDAA
jgi:prophage regulatory protein